MNCARDERLGGPDPCGRMPDMRRLSWLMGEGGAWACRGPWGRGGRPGLPVGLDCSKHRLRCLLREQAAAATELSSFSGFSRGGPFVDKHEEVEGQGG